MESKSHDMAVYYFRFFTLYRGRALLLILLGSIILGNNEHAFLLAAGILNLVFGLVYLVLSFVPQTPIPRPVYDNWQNWKEYSAEGLDLERPADDSDMMDSATRLKMSMLEKPQQSKINPI
ncbi:hypothetical protein MBANPS3_004987 [Mucor bainieri]